MQTLTVLPAPSTPPVLSDNDTFQKNVSALLNVDNRQLMAIRVLAKIFQLNANGGTDYRTDFPLLIQSTATAFGIAFNVTFSPYSESPINRWETVLDWSAGYTADNALPTDVEELIDDTRALVLYPEATLYQVLMFLRWKLAE